VNAKIININRTLIIITQYLTAHIKEIHIKVQVQYI